MALVRVARGGILIHLTAQLSEPECADSADRLLEAERSLEAMRASAIESVNARLDAVSCRP